MCRLSTTTNGFVLIASNNAPDGLCMYFILTKIEYKTDKQNTH